MIAYYWTPLRSELWEVSLIFYLIIGTGIKQLRENIAESKLSYEIMDDAAQAFLKTKIMDNIQKYFHLICFTAYLRDQSKTAKDGITDEDKKAFALTGGKGIFRLFWAIFGDIYDDNDGICFSVSTPTENLKLVKSFVVWMDEHKNLRTICEEGKGKNFSGFSYLYNVLSLQC